ncbi:MULTISPECIES: alpha-2-macroglobulin family protein [Empedobacter]|uniref:alpha-2-macroglobulin family protein n=2 Tax=Weeksellaceae TaxID=2762318 RepID=UPI0025779C98|nr:MULTISPECIES: alpha-2-macroglobulin family protein [Empedobacter]MDM1042037.1 TonB-dependent receptor plug domain-containing protein [Empedobacter brevis]MDM1136088.1 TonB-dependent receptor plug domain-containing protein [Empedobacter sp. R750]
MKQLLFLLLILTNSMLMAQSPTIDQKWKEIDQQMQNGQFKSIQPKIDELKALSRKQNNQQSYLKALFYEAKIKVATSDETDDVNFVFDLFKKDLDKKSNVNNAIVYSYLAELYQLYYNENRWKINSRTNVENQATNDVRFWTEDTFNKTINDYFSKSIQPKNELINAKSQDYKMILNLAEDKKNAQQQLDLTPTLYDVLAKKYINYLNQNDEKDKANQLLNDLVQLNTQKNNENAVLYNELILIDSKRGSTSVQEIIKQKESLATKYPKAWYSSYVYATLTTDYYGLQEDKLANVNKIFEIQQKVAKLYPNSEELENINNLVSKIKSQELSVQAERYMNENQNTPIQLTHKNLSQVFVKIFAYNEGFDGKQKIQALNVYNENRISEAQKFLNSLKVVEQYTIDVKSFEDYQNHSTIVKLNPLKSGRYIVLFSNNSEFKINTKDDIDYLDVMVSKYAINSLNEKVSVVNRETGKPESNVAVEFSNLTNYNKKEFKILTSDKDGMITIPSGWRNLQYRVKDEHTIYSAYYYDYDRYDDDNDSSVKIFTDRAIYRPGQTVYFKGIYYSSNDKSRNVVPNSKLTIALFDVNGKELSKVDLTTNEFGSVNGSFVLPSSALTGNFTIRPVNVQGYYSFKVEEYKRPKFKVEIEKNKGVYSLNDKVKVEGKAIAFSGANIDNAKVSYRVYRQEIFTFWPWYRSIPADRGEREEITFGDTTTDAEGKFNFEFVAKPASEKKKDEVRTYNYFIEVNATDINGETQSESSSVKVGDTRMSLNVAVSEKTKADDLKAFKVEVKNLNDEKLDGKGHIEIYSLNAPKEVVRRQKFTTDYNVYSKEEFKKLFPNEPYGDEMNPKTWTTNQKVFESDFDTKVSDEIQFNQASNLEEGYYVFKGFVMDGTQKVEVDKLVYVSNEKKANEIKTLLAVSPNQSTYQPKDVAKIEFKSGSKNTFVYYEVEANQTIIEKGFLDLSKKSVVEIPIKEEYRGGIYVNYAMTKFNDVQTGSLNLAIPFTNKQLKVTAEVLRDKLTPGAKEKWQLKIEGPNKDKVSAEVLASMYDASLDQFASNSLDFNVYNFTNSRRNNPFNLYQFYLTNPSRAIYYRTNYDFYARGYAGLDLNLFDFGFNQYRMNRRMMKSVAAPIQMNNELAGNVHGILPDSAYVTADLEGGVVTGMGIVRDKKSIGYASQEITIRGASSLQGNENALYVIDGVVYDKSPNLNPDDIQSMNILKGGEATALYGARGANGVVVITTKKGANAALDNVKARTNLNETAFFYPNLKTDAKGNVIVEFTTPESLTEWKFMAIAHTPDLKTGYLEQNVRTQKDLMVVPNMPRFLREGDQISVSSKINNLSDKVLNGSAKLMLFDAFTNQPIDAQFNLKNAVQNFSVAKGSSDQVTWIIDVPKNVQAVVYRVVASAGDFSDGEESALPILTNRMMVTETLPIYVKEGQKKSFQFENMINNKSTSLDNFKLTFEMTTNPIWYAIFSLPYLREYPYECAEQVFSRLYGNMISEKVINSNPKIKAVFDDWNKKGELKSKLQLNQDLKNIILEETPWVKNAESEEEQMKQIAVLFQLNQMQTEMKSAFQKLSDKQQSNGGFAWFDGGRPNEYITTHIVSGFGNMKKMDVNFKAFEIDVNPLIKKAIQFIDDENLKRFKEFKKDQKSFKDVVYSDGLHYLYARSFFLEDYPMSKELEEMKTAMLKNLNDTKLDLSLQQKAMAAIVMNRFQMQSAAKIVVNSIKEKAVESDEMGMYWKENQPGWFWYQAPVETQSLLIEAFDEVSKDEKSVEEMKVWLLKNRQTNQWNSTKATTKAVYALMNFGKSWIDADKGIEVKIGNQKFDLDKNAQAGSGYVKTSWNKEEIKPDMGRVEVSKTSPGVAWGAMYWQYFEDLDKIKSAETGIKFNKKLFVKSNSANGPILKEITTSTPIKVGDIVTVRLEISVDRNMQFVHIKDMRASGFEPVNVLSGYKWKGEFGYYESTRDAATNFFSDYMRKGTYVFEYDLKANNAGNFSNGITSMQNMYAPELSAQSEGIRVEIK